MNMNIKLQENKEKGLLAPEWAKDATQYFENVYGEQWIAYYNEETLKFAGLDIGWQEINATVENVKDYLKVAEGKISSMAQLEKLMKTNPMFKYMLNKEESLWLRSVANLFLDYVDTCKIKKTLA